MNEKVSLKAQGILGASNNDSLIQEHTNIIRSLVRREMRPGAVAFDVGSGTGRIMRVLVEEGFTVRGCEIDPDRAETACQVQGSSVDVMSVLEWEPPGRANVVTCIELIEHLCPNDQSRLLERMRAWLAPDGVLVLSTPQRYSVVSLIELAYSVVVRQPYTWWDPTHIAILSRTRLTRLLSTSGFKVIECVGYHMMPDLFAARVPALARFQRRAYHGAIKKLAFDLIYLARVSGTL
jgi:2-polyprenyl-3-methyl-5-hydroxy-6-metoxy-1,4-benzoquinol methylase